MANRVAVPASKRAKARAAKRAAKKTLPRRRKAAKTVRSTAKTAKVVKKTRSNGAHSGTNDGIRIRMYRVGFGDFFLLTVPTKSNGPQHILIDCGVHAANIGSMADCVADLAAVTGKKLALVIVTHYHADHLSGFATCDDTFAQFDVGAVWITNRLDPKDPQSMAFIAQMTALANNLRLQLKMRLNLDLGDDEKEIAEQALAQADNAIGAGFGLTGSANDKALELVTKGFRNKPVPCYYQAGDEPELPEVLKGSISARILGPSPKESSGDFSASDNKAEQYLAAVSAAGLPDTSRFEPFSRRWSAQADEYPREAFRPWAAPIDMENTLHALQPNALAAAASLIDGTLNNQSLAVLFTCRGRKLLFVGDAQWGNWAYWLYGQAVKGTAPGITDEARQILGSIDFYKVGHHGSTNATPIPAVNAMPATCAAMCSTETGYPKPKRTYGSIAKKTEVPRIALMEAIEQRTGFRLVRSDWIAVGKAPKSPEAHSQLEKLPSNFVEGPIYIDCFLAV